MVAMETGLLKNDFWRREREGGGRVKGVTFHHTFIAKLSHFDVNSSARWFGYSTSALNFWKSSETHRLKSSKLNSHRLFDARWPILANSLDTALMSMFEETSSEFSLFKPWSFASSRLLLSLGWAGVHRRVVGLWLGNWTKKSTRT